MYNNKFNSTGGDIPLNNTPTDDAQLFKTTHYITKFTFHITPRNISMPNKNVSHASSRKNIVEVYPCVLKHQIAVASSSVRPWRQVCPAQILKSEHPPR